MYLILDSGPLTDFLAQYFKSSFRLQPCFSKSSELSEEMVFKINRVIRNPRFSRICASSFAFVEIVRNWDEIVRERFEVYQLQAFISDPPEWFLIEPLDENIIQHMCLVSPTIRMDDSSLKPLEWTDAIHAATAIARENSILITNDVRLKQIRE